MGAGPRLRTRVCRLLSPLTPARAPRSLYASYGSVPAAPRSPMSVSHPITMGARAFIGTEQRRGSQTYFVPPGVLAPTSVRSMVRPPNLSSPVSSRTLCLSLRLTVFCIITRAGVQHLR